MATPTRSWPRHGQRRVAAETADLVWSDPAATGRRGRVILCGQPVYADWSERWAQVRDRPGVGRHRATRKQDPIRDTAPVSTFGARGKALEVGLRRDEASPKRSRRVVASVRSHSCRAVAVTVETNHDRDVPADRVAESVAAYTAHAHEYETAHTMKRLDAVERFARSLPAPSLILDVGCGPGHDLARSTSLGHVARGVELKPVFAAMANAHARPSCTTSVS